MARSFTYHQLDSVGLGIELVDVSRQSEFLNAWCPAAAAMPILELETRGPDDE